VLKKDQVHLIVADSNSYSRDDEETVKTAQEFYKKEDPSQSLPPMHINEHSSIDRPSENDSRVTN